MPRRWAGSPRAAPEYGADGPVLLREIGSKLADFILGFAELGWYAGHRHGRYLVGEDPRSARGADPAVDGAVWYSVLRHRAGGLQGAGRAVAPVGAIDVCAADGLHVSGAAPRRRLAGDDPYCAERHHDWSAAITMVFGTFASGAATNWTRLANSSRTAILASMGSFLIGNGLMIVAGTVRYRLSTGRYR